MIKGIWGIEPSAGIPLFEKVWRFRHRHFVERFGWEALRKPDGREIDQFDTAEAIHLPLIDEDGHVLGYSRLLKTTAPHLLSDVYPELMDGQTWPTGTTVYEWTRCVAEPNATIGGISASNALLTGVLEYCLTAGITALIVETHPKLVQLLVNNDWNVLPLSSPTMLGPDLVLPIHAEIAPRALMAHHRNYGINGSLLDLTFCPANPLRPQKELRMLPYLDGPHLDVNATMRIAGE